MHPFGNNDPAVIVASSNTRLRQQIVQSLTAVAHCGSRGAGRGRCSGQAGKQRMPAAAARPQAARSGCGRVAADHPPALSRNRRAAARRGRASRTARREWRSASALRLFETINRWQAPQAPSSVASKPPAVLEPLPGMVGQARLHGSGVPHGAAGGAAHHAGADHRSHAGQERKLWPAQSIS